MVQRGPPNGRRRALAFELSPPAVSYRSLGGRRVPQQAGLSPLRPSPIHGGSGAPSPGAAWTNLLSTYVHRATSRSRTNDRPTVLQERNPRAPRVGDLPRPQHTRAPPANGRLTCAPSRSASPRPRPEEGHAAPHRRGGRGARPSRRRRVARPQACAQGAYNPPPKESSARSGLAGLAMTLTGCRLRPRGGTSGSALEPLGDLPQLKRRAEPVEVGSGWGPLAPPRHLDLSLTVVPRK